MLKVGDKVQLIRDQSKKGPIGEVRNGPYRREFQALYPDHSPTTFVDDVYDVQFEGEVVEGIRRKYMQKVH